jgi:hypothetical protein
MGTVTKRVLSWALLAGALVTLAGCGETSGSVLELVPESGPGGTSGPPGSKPRVDVFVVRHIDACAVGEPCRQDDPDTYDGECLEIDEGDRTTSFRANTVWFLAPGDPYLETADHVACFSLIIDDEEMAAIDYEFKERFYGELYELSGREIVADIKIHEIPTIQGGLGRYENESGIFLPPETLSMAPSLASRYTDFTFAVTGARDPNTGAAPRNEHCAGTVQEIQDGLAGAGYTWLSTECNRVEILLRAWMYQVRVFLPDVNDFNDYYDDFYTDDCSDPTPDPTRWWPSPNDCAKDPDSPTCGDDDCDEREFTRHVLTDHWPRRSPYVGNHCNNLREDRHLGEVGTDSGGVCDFLDLQETATRTNQR